MPLTQRETRTQVVLTHVCTPLYPIHVCLTVIHVTSTHDPHLLHHGTQVLTCNLICLTAIHEYLLTIIHILLTMTCCVTHDPRYTSITQSSRRVYHDTCPVCLCSHSAHAFTHVSTHEERFSSVLYSLKLPALVILSQVCWYLKKTILLKVIKMAFRMVAAAEGIKHISRMSIITWWCWWWRW